MADTKGLSPQHQQKLEDISWSWLKDAIFRPSEKFGDWCASIPFGDRLLTVGEIRGHVERLIDYSRWELGLPDTRQKGAPPKISEEKRRNLESTVRTMQAVLANFRGELIRVVSGDVLKIAGDDPAYLMRLRRLTG